MQKSDNLLKEAILRELLRGGQVFLLHNDVASIERMAETVPELCLNLGWQWLTVR